MGEGPGSAYISAALTRNLSFSTKDIGAVEPLLSAVGSEEASGAGSSRPLIQPTAAPAVNTKVKLTPTAAVSRRRRDAGASAEAVNEAFDAVPTKALTPLREMAWVCWPP